MSQPTSVYSVSFALPVHLRRAALALVACVALVLGMGAPVAAAENRAQGTLFGTVSGAEGAIQFASVYAYGDDDFGYGFTDEDGGYSFTVEPGEYTVCVYSPDYIEVCDRDVVVASGGTTQHDIVLERYSHITGTVTGVGGAPLDNAEVRALVYIDEEGYWDTVGYTRSENDGSYDMEVPAGEYAISFSSPRGQGYRTEYFENVTDIEDATLVPVDEDSPAEVDAELSRTAGISGHVEFADGDPTYGMVSLYNGADQLRRTVRVKSDGTFSVWNLKPGTYKVAFNRLSGYAVSEAQIYIGKPESDGLGAADSFALGVDEHVTLQDAVLNQGGSVSGLLQDTAGTPLADCLVQAYAPGLVTRAGWTGEDGTFSVGGLTTGDYKVRVLDEGNRDDCDGGDQFYDGPDGVLSTVAGDAVTVSVTAGDDLDLANPLTYQRAGRIAGTVTLPPGRTYTDRTVYAIDLATHKLAARARVTSDGTYELRGLAGGTYRVTFNRVSGQAVNAAQFFDGKAEHLGHASADEVDVVFGQVTDQVDATLATGGSITGRLVSSTGASMRYCYIQAYTEDNALVTRGDFTDGAGYFSIGGLTTGDYKIRVPRNGRCRAGVQFYVGGDGQLVTTPGTAVDVSVTLGAETALPTDLVYSKGGSISGTVDLPEGADRFVDGRLRIVDADTGDVVRRLNVLRFDGDYKIGGLPAGSYRVVFNRVSGMAFAAAQFYDGKAEPLGSGAADVIELDANESVTGIDATLVEGGSISGTLVDAEGDPLQCEVQAFTPQNKLVTRTAYPETDGSFTIGGLSTGSYFVRVLPDGDGCNAGRQFVKNDGGALAETLAGAEAVSVTIGVEKVLAPDLVYGGDAPVEVIANSVKPAISGTAQVGQTLTASTGTWTPSGLTYAYQWKSGGTDVGTDAATYVPVAGDVGKTITVTVTASKTGLSSVSETSNPTAAVTAAPLPDVVNNTAPSITGTAQVGQTLTADPGTWTPSGVTFAYQWKANGTDIAGADDSTYVPVAGDVGKTITVRVTGSKAGHNPASATSSATAAVTAAPPGEVIANSAVPTVSGTAQVGKTLTASTGTWTPGGLAYAYAWKLGGVPVAGATSSSFLVPTTAVGKTVTVTVTASKTGLTPASATSAPTSAVTAATFTLTKAPTIKGKAKVGKSLKYKAGTISPAPTTVTLQWLRNGKVIKGATAAKYKLKKKDKGKKISLQVTYTKVGYTTLVSTTKQTIKVVLP